MFHNPASSPASRSPSVSWLAGRERDRLFSSFVRNALGSCIDYAPVTSLPLGVPAATGVDAAELAFELDENLPEAEPSCEPYAHELLVGAQARHRIFRDELVVKAFFEAESYSPLRVSQLQALNFDEGRCNAPSLFSTICSSYSNWKEHG